MSLDVDFAVLFQSSLLLTSISALWTGVWLWWHSRFQPSLKPLAGFSAMMAVWSAGHFAMQHDQVALGHALILANPLMPTCFLLFALLYLGDSPQPRWVRMLQQSAPLWLPLSSLVVLLSWWLPSSTEVSLHQIQLFFVFSGFGWLNLGYTVLVGMLAHGVLWQGRHAYQGTKGFSIVAITMTAGLGLLLATSFVFPSFGLDWYPWPMLLLPVYLVLLVYAVVRYQMLAVNAFASRALVYLVMALLLLVLMGLISALFGQLGMPALNAVPGYQLWLYSTLLLALAAAAYRPASSLAERLIYPGVQLNNAMVQQWQQQLASAQDWPELASIAAELIAKPLKQPLQIRLLQVREPQGEQLLAQSTPCALQLQLRFYTAEAGSRDGAVLDATRQGVAHQGLAHQGVANLAGAGLDGSSRDPTPQGWQFELVGDSALTPTLRLTAEVFASLLVSSCERLQSALALASAKKQQLAQQHLVELGALAAAMAHELRNPLNIISMASAGVDAELRGHIQSQLKRADRLIADMLVYAGRLNLQCQLFPLKPLAQSVIERQLAAHVAVNSAANIVVNSAVNRAANASPALSPAEAVQITLDIDDALQLYADPYRVQQVLQNLIDNALAFLLRPAATSGRTVNADVSPTPQLRIAAQPMAGDAKRVQIWVQNNGPAVDASLLDGQLFRPFISKRPGGSGLGLAIVQRIVQAHGGQISHHGQPAHQGQLADNQLPASQGERPAPEHGHWPVEFVFDLAGATAP